MKVFMVKQWHMQHVLMKELSFMLIDHSVVLRALGLAHRLRRGCFPTRLDKILAINGWTLKPQLQYLMTMVRSLPDHSNIVEIGVWQGRSALAMAEACRGTGKKVFAIDPWQDYVQGGIQVSNRLIEWGVTSFEDVYDAFQLNCLKLELKSWVHSIRSTSLHTARDWPYGPVAMVFIDGNHDYDAVTADLNAWISLVQWGGLICGDDWGWGSVRAAVTRFMSGHPGYRLELPCENTWAFFKT